MIYITKAGQSVYDIALATYGDIGYVYQLLQDNPVLTNIDTSPAPGTSVTWTPVSIQPPQVASISAFSPLTSVNYISKAGQTLYDICLQVYGTLDKLYRLIQDSNFDSLLSYPIPGTLFKFNPSNSNNILFANWLKNNTITIGTKDMSIIGGALQTDSGINITTDDGTQITID